MFTASIYGSPLAAAKAEAAHLRCEIAALKAALHGECGFIRVETSIGEISLESRVLIRAASLAAND